MKTFNYIMATALLATACSTLGACAGGLSVNVDVLDSGYLSYLNQRDDVRKEARSLALADYSQTAIFLNETEKAVTAAANAKCYEVARKALPNIKDDKIRTQFEKSLTQAEQGGNTLGDDQKNSLREMRQGLNNWDYLTSSDLNHHFGTAPWFTSDQYPIPQQALDLLAKRRSIFEYAKIHRNTLVNDAAQGCIQLAQGFTKLSVQGFNTNAVTSQIVSEVNNNIVDNILGGGSLLSGKQGAFHVANAKEKFWAPNFNKAFGHGQFGNTSTAIKINGVADYTVKGFSFDGRSTASMIRKLTVPTVSFAAAMAGIPVSLSGSEASPNGAESFDSNLLTTADAEIANIEIKNKIHKRALKNIANVILTYKPQLQSTVVTTEKTRAKKTIMATFDANASILE